MSVSASAPDLAGQSYVQPLSVRVEGHAVGRHHLVQVVEAAVGGPDRAVVGVVQVNRLVLGRRRLMERDIE